LKKSRSVSQKIVVKVGSSVLTGGGVDLVPQNLARVVSHVASFREKGDQVILVTSGAIACGLSVLGFKKRPTALAELQAAAAAGQNILMQEYFEEFSEHGLKCAQVLLTRGDLTDRKRYLNARNTINTLLKHGLVPVVNENDAVSVEEIKFGDNDTLAARLAVAVEADGLWIMSDIDGLYKDFDAKTGLGKNLIEEVNMITPEIIKMAGGTDKTSCVGGMSTKIQAAHIATSGNIPVCLSAMPSMGVRIDFGASVYEGFVNTHFQATGSAGSAKKHWIAFEAAAKGRIVVDDGARNALTQRPCSLLAPGVMACEGVFKAGDIVEVVDKAGAVFAKGKANLSSKEIAEGAGKKIKKEVIHRDHLVILG